jgi:Aerotolerance regulator N-terminal/von Willebrand factor type A domain
MPSHFVTPSLRHFVTFPKARCRMTFLHPMLAAVGLASVAIPIIIHLLMRRRRKPIMWGAMRFLMEAYRKHKRRLRLEQLLLLAARCLLVALIAMALARPMLGAAGVLGRARQATTLYLVIDNSLTSQALADGSSALDHHKEQAIEAIGQLDAAMGDRAALITLGGPAQPIVLPPSADLAAIRSLVDGLSPTQSAMDLTGAAQAIRTQRADSTSESGPSVVLVLSGFRSGSADLERVLPELASDAQTTVLASAPTEIGVENVALVSVEPLRSVMIAEGGDENGSDIGRGESSSVRVVLRRSGPGTASAATTTINIRLVGSQGGEARASDQVRWKPGETQTSRIVSLAASPGEGRALLYAELSADGLMGDNLWRRPIEVRRSLRVATISPRKRLGSEGLNPENAADWLRAALAPISLDRERFTSDGSLGTIDVVNIDPGSLDAARLAELDAAFVTSPEMIDDEGWARLRVLANGGALVVVIPPTSAGVNVWTDAFTSAMGLSWTIGRESREHETPAALAVDRPTTGTPDLLTMIAPELADLARPVRIFKSLSITIPSGEGETILSLASGEPFIAAGPPGLAGEAGEAGGRGFVVLFGSSLAASWTDIATQPIFLPLVQEMLRQGIGRAVGSWTSTAGLPVALPLGVNEIQPMNSEGPAIVATRATTIREAGVWRAMDERGIERGLIAINADADAANTDIQTTGAVRTWLDQLSPQGVRWLAGDDTQTQPDNAISVGEVLSGKPDTSRSSLWLLVGALVLAVFEVALARWFSHATVAPTSAQAGATA